MIEIMELDILVKTIFVWFSCYLCRESDRIFQLIFFFSLFDASLFPPRTTNVVLVIVRRRVLSPGNETTMYSSYIDFFQDNNITIQLLQRPAIFSGRLKITIQSCSSYFVWRIAIFLGQYFPTIFNIQLYNIFAIFLKQYFPTIFQFYSSCST